MVTSGRMTMEGFMGHKLILKFIRGFKTSSTGWKSKCQIRFSKKIESNKTHFKWGLLRIKRSWASSKSSRMKGLGSKSKLCHKIQAWRRSPSTLLRNQISLNNRLLKITKLRSGSISGLRISGIEICCSWRVWKTTVTISLSTKHIGSFCTSRTGFWKP